MTSNTLSAEADAQQVLNELWSEQLIPFALNVGRVTKGPVDYTLYFHDARMHSVSFTLVEGRSFPEMVRAAVLDRVARMSGPLRNWQN